MTLLFQILRKKLTKSKENSLKVYARALKRLYNVVERKEAEVPESVSWLKEKKLKSKYEAKPVNIRRHLSSAAHIYLKAVDKEDEYWKDQMFSDQDKYRENRKKNNKSDKETKLWIDDGLKKLKQASSEFKRRISKKLKREDPNEQGLWNYTQYLIMRFYSEVQLRNDLATITLKNDKDKNNYLQKIKGGVFKLIMRTFKASEKIGEREIILSKPLSKVLTEYMKYRAKVDIEHDHLLSNSAGGILSKPALGKILRKLTKEFLGKAIGTRILRLFNATNNAAILKKAAKVSNDMLHSSAQSRQYVRK